jgi:hypothetical protein
MSCKLQQMMRFAHDTTICKQQIMTILSKKHHALHATANKTFSMQHHSLRAAVSSTFPRLLNFLQAAGKNTFSVT